MMSARSWRDELVEELPGTGRLITRKDKKLSPVRAKVYAKNEHGLRVLRQVGL